MKYTFVSARLVENVVNEEKENAENCVVPITRRISLQSHSSRDNIFAHS